MTDAKPLVQSSSGMIHVEGCPHIAHYVNGQREKITYDQDVYHDITRVDPQTELVRTITSGRADKQWVSVRIDPDRLAQIGSYSRCSHCAPEVPEYVPGPRHVSKESGALTHKDVGRESVDGRIVGIRHVADGVEVTFGDDSVRTYEPAERLEFVVAARGPRVTQP